MNAARDCPSPLLNQDEKTSDNEEEDQSFVCPRPTFRMTMQSKVEGEEGVDFGGENLSYPPFQHKTTGGMRRSKVIRRKRDRSPQGARSREESPGDDEGGGRVCVNLDINDGARLAVVSQKESRHSRENTPKIVVDAPKPDSHHRLSAPTEKDYVLISAPRPASPAMGDKRGPGTDAVVGVSAGNSPEQSRGFANLVGSPPHKVLSDLVEADESGSTTFHRRSRVLSGRPRMSRTRNTDEVGRSGSLGESDVGSTSQLCDARNPEEKPGGAESMITQGDNGGDFRKTKPLFQAAVGGAGEGTPPGSSDIAALAGGDVTMVSVGGSVAAVASALGATEEFKKVKTGPPSEADGAGVLTTGGEARTTEFRKVKVNTPSPQTITESSAPEGSQIGLGDELFRKVKVNTPSPQTITESSAPEGSQIGLGDELFRKVKVNTPSPQTITESSAPEGSQIGLGDELFRKVKVNTPSPQTTTASSAPEGSQIGLGDELFRKVKVNTPSPQSTDAGVPQTNLDEFRKVKVNSEKPVNALSCQQSHDRNTEPQTQALANNLSESERTLPPQGSPPQGSPLEDSLLRNSPSEAPSESNQSSEHMPPVHKEGRRRRVIQSLHTSEEGVGTVVPQQLSDSNLQIQSHVDHVESSIGGGGGGGDGEKQATACVQPPDGTSGVQETPIATLLTASVTSEFSVHEGEEGTLQSSLQGSGARADETGEGAQSSQQGYQWRRREARRSRHIDDESELGPLPRSRVISGGSPLPRRHLKSHGNASHAKEDM